MRRTLGTKFLSLILSAAIVLPILIFPQETKADTNSVTVTTLAEFNTALANDDVDTIVITKEIALTAGTYDGAMSDGSPKTITVEKPFADENGNVNSSYSTNRLFTVASGVSVTLKNMYIIGGGYESTGDTTLEKSSYSGAIYNKGSLSIDKCTLTRSRRVVYNDAGAYCQMTDCNIVRNTSKAGGALYAYGSGSIFVLDGCSFSENRSLNNTGGGGMEISTKAVLYANNCIISNNASAEAGGAINVYSESSAYLMNCTITGNVCGVGDKYKGTYYGGGLAAHLGCKVYALNCLFCNNRSNGGVSGDYASDVGVYGSSNQATSYGYFYHCVYGNAAKNDLGSITIDSTCTKVTTDDVFAKYTNSSIPVNLSDRTSAFNHPCLITYDAQGRPDYFYSPLNKAKDDEGNLVTKAATGGVKTYFSYSSSGVYMSYDNNGTNTKFGGAGTSSTVVNTYYESSLTNENRADSDYAYIGASNVANTDYYTVTLSNSSNLSNGTVEGIDIYGTTYQQKTMVTMTATPNSGYVFYGWYDVTGDETTLLSSESTYTHTLLSDITIDAVYGTTIDIGGSTVTASAEDSTYDGTAKTPLPTLTWTDSVTNEEVTLTEGTDYTITSYADNTNAGTATITVTGMGKFTGTREITFEIAKATQTLTIALDKLDDGKVYFTLTTNDTDENVAYTAEVTEGTDIATVAVSGNEVILTPTAAGHVKFVVNSAATDNFSSAETSYSCTVSTLLIAAVAGNTTLTYTGEAQDAGEVQITKQNDSVSYDVYYSADNETWSEDMVTYTEAGRYTTYYKIVAKGTRTVTDDDGTTKTEDAEEEITDSWTTVINTADNSWKTALSMEGWTYGDDAKSPSAESDFGTPTYTYWKDKACTTAAVEGDSSAVPSDAGTYYVLAGVEAKASEHDTTVNDYTALKSSPVSFTIERATVDIPEGKTLEYTASEQTGYDTSDLYKEASGTGSATKPGTYTVFLELTDDNHKWSDGTLANKNIEWTITRAKVDKPTAASDLAYTGEEQTGVAEATGYTVTNGKATEPGDYTATATLTDTTLYVWSDDTEDPVEVAWSIAKAKIAVPTAATGLVYSGSEQTGVASDKLYSVTDGSATNAGSYTATASLTDTTHYTWTDGTQDAKTVDWSIAKADPTLTVKYVSTDDSTNVATFSIEYTGDGDLSVALDETSTGKATLSISDDKLTITADPSASGTIVFTVTSTETTNYNSAKTTCSANVSNLTVVASAQDENLTYTGSAQDAGSVTVSTPESGYVISYSTDNETWSETLPTVTEAGEYTIYYKVVATADVTYLNEDGTENKTTEEETATGSWKVTVAGTENSWETTPSIEGWTYGETGTPSGAAKFQTDSEPTFLYSDSVDGEYTTTMPTAAGTYYMKATVAAGMSSVDSTRENYSALESTPVEFTISKATLKVTATDNSKTYGDVDPTLEASASGLADGDELDSYTISRASGESVGSYTISVSDAKITSSGTDVTANYEISYTTGTFKITESDVDITIDTSAKTYNGSAQTTTITVKDKTTGKTLTEGTDYTVTYTDNTNAGTATVKVEVNSPYSGAKTSTFKINPKSVKSADVTLSQDTYTYTGSAIKPSVTVKLDGKTLKSGTDYEVSYKNNTNAGTATVTVKGKGNYTDSANRTFTIKAKSTPTPTATPTPVADGRLTYRTHIQDIGWQEWKNDGELSGTTGRSKRIESIQIKLDGVAGGITYQTHVQSYGWQSWKSDGATAGTTGEAKRLEAIKIKLTGQAAQIYDVYYRVHAQHFGWLDWAKNGEAAGTAGFSFRLEAIEIVLVEKGGSAPGKTDVPFRQATIRYQTHVQTQGWQGLVGDGITSGTTGKGLRVEALRVNLNKQDYDGSVTYRAHVQDYGWMDWVSDGEDAGTTGQSKRLEAVEIKLTGDMADNYDIYYRVHVQNIGWLDWAKNGQTAGTTGYGYRVEALEILLLPKGADNDLATANPSRSK